MPRRGDAVGVLGEVVVTGSRGIGSAIGGVAGAVGQIIRGAESYRSRAVAEARRARDWFMGTVGEEPFVVPGPYDPDDPMNEPFVIPPPAPERRPIETLPEIVVTGRRPTRGNISSPDIIAPSGDSPARGQRDERPGAPGGAGAPVLDAGPVPAVAPVPPSAPAGPSAPDVLAAPFIDPFAQPGRGVGTAPIGLRAPRNPPKPPRDDPLATLPGPVGGGPAVAFDPDEPPTTLPFQRENQCQCPPDDGGKKDKPKPNKPKKRKPRDMCWKGTYTEKAMGLHKSPRVRVDCITGVELRSSRPKSVANARTLAARNSLPLIVPIGV